MAGFPWHINHCCALSWQNKRHSSLNFRCKNIAKYFEWMNEYVYIYACMCILALESKKQIWVLVSVGHSSLQNNLWPAGVFVLLSHVVSHCLCHFLHVFRYKMWFGDQTRLGFHLAQSLVVCGPTVPFNSYMMGHGTANVKHEAYCCPQHLF